MMSDLMIYDGLFRDGAPAREEYFSALLPEAVRCGVLTAAEEMHIRRQVMVVLAERIRCFTNGESTALREETADRLLASVLYTVSVSLIRAGSHRAAVTILREQSLTAIYDGGMTYLLEKKKQAHLLSLLLLRTQLPGMSGGYDRFVGRDAYRYVQNYDALYNAGAELFVRIDEMGIRQTCRGLLRVSEIMAETVRFNQIRQAAGRT